ncbi:unnamed protein product [Mucor hiemalis]
MKGDATPSQISAFLISLKLQGKDKDPKIVAACATAMLDIVGTGGDGHDTYNVSTTASIIAAGAGAKVAKVLYYKWSKRIES